MTTYEKRKAHELLTNKLEACQLPRPGLGNVDRVRADIAVDIAARGVQERQGVRDLKQRKQSEAKKNVRSAHAQLNGRRFRHSW